MARYIDADWLYEKVENRYRVSSGIEHRCERNLLDLICEAPTADVAPKSEVDEIVRQWKEEANCWQNNYIAEIRDDEQIKKEVAREIFEEIEDSIAVHAFTRKSEDYAEGMYDAIEWVDSKIAELKKKYTGEQT